MRSICDKDCVRTIALFAAMWLASACWAIAAPPASQPTGDPMAWSAPAALPPPRERLDRKQFDTQFAAEEAQLDKTILNLPDPPLEKSDRYVTATEWFPARAYANGGDRSPKWDSLMLVACRDYLDNPEMAETALLRAQQAGYRGWVLDALETRIAMRDLRLEDALAYGSAALKRAPDDRKPVVAGWMYVAAILDYKLPLAAQLSQEYPVANLPEQITFLKKQIALARGSSHFATSPAAMAAEIGVAKSGGKPPAATAPENPLEPADLTPKIQIQKVKGDTAEPAQAKVLRKGEMLKLAAPGDHYQESAFGPPASNCLLSFNVKLAASDKKQSDSDRFIFVEMIDLKHPKVAVMRITLATNGAVIADFAGAGDVGMQLSPQTRWGSNGAEVRLVVLGHDCEVTVDGRRVFYGTFAGDPATRRVVFGLQACGVHAEFRDLKWIQLRSPDHG